jgi:anaerobic nitric oxide reductase flavorubredoxin
LNLQKQQRGTTYNSYLLQDERSVLIDTVWSPFGKDFVENMKKQLGLGTIDYIVANHAETDHSGALSSMMKATDVRAKPICPPLEGQVR